MEADGWKVLLVATRRSANKWVFPKGAIGRDERPKAAAIRETREVRGTGLLTAWACGARGVWGAVGEAVQTVELAPGWTSCHARQPADALIISLIIMSFFPTVLHFPLALSSLSLSTPLSVLAPSLLLPLVSISSLSLQEAGVTGTIGPKLGPFEIKAGHQVQKMWLLYVDTVLTADDPAWDERGVRERRWCPIEDAPKLLNPDNPTG